MRQSDLVNTCLRVQTILKQVAFLIKLLINIGRLQQVGLDKLVRQPLRHFVSKWIL